MRNLIYILLLLSSNLFANPIFTNGDVSRRDQASGTVVYTATEPAEVLQFYNISAAGMIFSANSSNNIYRVIGGSFTGCLAKKLIYANDYIEFSFISHNGSTNLNNDFVGLGLTTDATHNFTNMLYSFRDNGNTYNICENGITVNINYTDFKPTDRFKIAIVNDSVKYYINGVFIRKSNTKPTLPLAFDCALAFQYAGVGNLKIDSSPAKCPPIIIYSLDSASLNAGNTINTSTGAVTYVSTWIGNSYITAITTKCSVVQGYSVHKSITIQYTTQTNLSIKPSYKYSIYVDSIAGNDSGDGSINNPYRSFTKVYSVLKNSTLIYVKRGSVFTNNLVILNKNQIGMIPYGSGDTVTIDGRRSLTGTWHNTGSNIWWYYDATFPTEISNVFFNDIRKPVSRQVGTKLSINQPTITSLRDTTDHTADHVWDSCRIVFQHYPWSELPQVVTSYVNRTWNWAPNKYDYTGTTQTMVYWLQNHKSLITASLPWAYNSLSKVLYVYSVGTPANIKVSYVNNLIYVENSHNITIEGFRFIGSNECAIKTINNSDVIIQNNTFRYSGFNSILADSVSGITISHCKNFDSNNKLCMIWRSNNINLNNNYIDWCERIFGMSNEDSRMDLFKEFGSAMGMCVKECQNANITNNEVLNTGYTGLGVFSTNCYIHKNYFSHNVLNKKDGGNVYLINDYGNTNISNYHNSTYSFQYYGLTNPNNILSFNALDENDDALVASLHNNKGLYADWSNLMIDFYNNVSAGQYWNHSSGVTKMNFDRNTLYSNLVNGNSENVSMMGWQNYFINDTIKYLNNFIIQTGNASRVFQTGQGFTASRYIKFNGNIYFFPQIYTTDTIKFFISTLSKGSFGYWMTQNLYGQRGKDILLTTSTHIGSAKPLTDFMIPIINHTNNAKTYQQSDFPYTDYIDAKTGVPLTFPYVVTGWTWTVIVRPPN